MDAIELGSRLLLAAILIVAGAAKLADQPGARRALVDFGVRGALVRLGAIALPLAEIGIGLALLSAATAWPAAIGAILVLAAFAAGIGYQMARGRSPECHCFGALSSSRAGPRTLARNVGLAALGAVVVVRGPEALQPGPIDWLIDAGPAWQLVAVTLAMVGGAIARGAWLLLEVVRQQGRLILRIESLEEAVRSAAPNRVPASPSAPDRPAPAPTPAASQTARRAPAFRLEGLHGEVLTLDSLLARGRPVLLAFIDPGCAACDALLPDLARWQAGAADVTVAVIGRGSVKEMRVKIGDARIHDVLLQEDREVARAYGSPATPAAVVIEADGTVLTPAAQGAGAIRDLVDRRRWSRVGLAGAEVGAATAPPVVAGADPSGNHRHQPTVDRLGQPAPPFDLRALAGGTVALSDLSGERSVLLFWDPACGFCRQMVDDLKGFETSPPAGAPRLIVVAAGSQEANAALSLRSPVLLDAAGDVAASYGAHGTPMAVVVDEWGRIASPVAAGAPAVLALLQNT